MNTKENKFETVIVLHNFNGFEDDADDFVEIEGKKFEKDPNDPSKAKLGEDGKPIEFIEKKKDNEEGKENKTLDQIIKDNPELQKMFEEKKKLEEEKAKREEEEKKKEEDEKIKDGKLQEIIDSRNTEIQGLKDRTKKQDDILNKYIDTIGNIVEELKKNIPKENLALIPEDYKKRQQLEYIIKNAKFLGLKTSLGVGAGVPKNDDNINLTEEAKLIEEIEELKKKENKTRQDQDLLYEKAMKLKEIREAKK